MAIFGIMNWDGVCPWSFTILERERETARHMVFLLFLSKLKRQNLDVSIIFRTSGRDLFDLETKGKYMKFTPKK